MSKHRVIVLSVINNQLTVTEASARFGLSRQRIYQLLSRYRQGGIEAVEPRSHRPKSNPRATPGVVRDRIVELRIELTKAGLDAGPVSIASRLEFEGHRPPSTSTIRRILHVENLVSPEPKKRPKSSLRRFEADQPNETWQSDFTHWRLADNTDIEILNWLDDHSRYLLAITAHQPVTGTVVLNEFTRVINEYGPPASTLTDNGLVYTARFRGGKNAFEYLLATLGIKQKNGSPGHPQTQGKIERFHQTLKKWLTAQPRAQTVQQLQEQLDKFRDIYNNQRPHRALAGATPATAYAATIKATPDGHPTDPHYRIRFDIVDQFGKLTLRRAGKLHHLGIGRIHAHKPALIIADQTTVTVIDRQTGEIFSEHDIDPTRNYWRNKQRSPGRWPGQTL